MMTFNDQNRPCHRRRIHARTADYEDERPKPVVSCRAHLYGLPTSSTKRLPDIVDKRTKRTVHFSLGTVLIAVKGVSRHASIVLRRARQFTVALAPASPVEPAPISSGPGHVA